MHHPDAVLALLDLAPSGRVDAVRLVDPDAPALHALDLAATRGDGVFETISIGRGHPQALRPHLTRLASSAAMLDLPAPDLDGWREVVQRVADALGGHEEAWVKIVLSRGVDGGDRPTGWAWGEPSADFSVARTEGIRVALLDRGYRSDVARTSPWLLAGAKTLSYATNMAARREAVRRGADDALFVSTDGLVLEGPTANLVVRLDGVLATPRTDVGILPGTTQADLFRWAAGQGIPTRLASISPQDLQRADAAWMVSSVRHAAPVRAIDDRAVPVDAELSAAMNAYLSGRTE
ncbi:aminodeoxychorismate lyase [Schumannella soli]|uniref:Aminodeoxychorismate lyase n=1 Tax=Schumannella soli TaxID=2590779 RepID=A0A506Y4T8_9MICO|nr:aminodeoxychorismate lyase [Schumannella soli]TPW76038.1 aminodeoxychorismate lyase [Schumannella soli]